MRLSIDYFSKGLGGASRHPTNSYLSAFSAFSAVNSNRFLREIWAGEFFVVLSRGIVVCPGGVDFVGEISEVFSPAVKDDCGPPHAFVGGEPPALIAGAGVSLLRVPGVLGDGRQAQIGPAVVEAGAVHMVDDITIAEIAMIVLSFEFWILS